jgi:FixJ family two-component response regulator
VTDAATGAVSGAGTGGPTVHLVDDDPAVRRALARVLAAAGHACRTWESAEDFLAAPRLPSDGCAVLDLALPGASGLDLQRRLGERDPGFPVIFLTGRGDIGTSVRAMKGGAVDFLTKPVEPAALVAAVEAALARGRDSRQAQAAEAERAARVARLTPREREVLEMVVQGRLNKQIAADLGIAEKTIKVHRARVMQKLGVRTIADLVRLVLGRGA